MKSFFGLTVRILGALGFALVAQITSHAVTFPNTLSAVATLMIPYILMILCVFSALSLTRKKSRERGISEGKALANLVPALMPALWVNAEDNREYNVLATWDAQECGQDCRYIAAQDTLDKVVKVFDISQYFIESENGTELERIEVGMIARKTYSGECIRVQASYPRVEPLPAPKDAEADDAQSTIP